MTIHQNDISPLRTTFKGMECGIVFQGQHQTLLQNLSRPKTSKGALYYRDDYAWVNNDEVGEIWRVEV